MGSLSGIEVEFAVWISGGLRNKFPLPYCEVAMDHSFTKQTCHGYTPWKFGIHLCKMGKTRGKDRLGHHFSGENNRVYLFNITCSNL